jgi:hypothetical protein
MFKGKGATKIHLTEETMKAALQEYWNNRIVREQDYVQVNSIYWEGAEAAMVAWVEGAKEKKSRA